MSIFLRLYLAFFQIGGCTFGGGYAMLPILQREIVDKHHWATENDLTDYYAIGQCTPGVIAVNVATFIGYKVAGKRGAACATAGVVSPSLLIITIIAAFIQQFASLPVVQHAFGGIRIAVCALVIYAVYNLIRKGIVDALTAGIMVASFVAVAFFKVSPVVMVLVGGGAGVLAGTIRRTRS